MIRIRKRSKKVTKTNQKTLGKSIEERPECINDRSEFGSWEIDLVLGKKTKGEALMLTLLERQTRYAVGVKLKDKHSYTINSVGMLMFTLHIPILHMREEQTRTSMASSENISLKESHLIH